MAERQFYRPSNRKEEDDGMYDDDSWKLASQQQSGSMHAASSKADQTLGDIDDLLNDSSSDGSTQDSYGSSSGTEKSAADRTAASTDGKAKSADELKNAEKKTSDDTVGKGYSSSKHGDDKTGRTNVKVDEQFWTNRKKAGVGVGALVGGGVAALGLGTITGGTTAVTMAASYLNLPAQHQEEQSSDRIGKMMGYYRFAQTGDVGYMRMGPLGGQVFKGALAELDKAGVTYNRDSVTGKPKGITIDQEKLSKNVTSLEGVKPGSDAARQIVAERLGVGMKSVTVGADGKINVDLKGINQKGLRLVTDKSTRIIADPKAINTAGRFYLKKAFNLPGIMHPFKKLTAAAEQKLVDAVRARKEKEGKSPAQAEKEAKAQAAIEGESERYKSSIKSLQPEAKASAGKIKTAQSGLANAAVKGLTFTGALCIARAEAANIAKANRDLVVLPGVVQATQVIAAAGQSQFGYKDVTLEQVNAMAASWRNEDGSTIFDGKAMQYLADPNKTPKGPDLDPEYKQAFDGNSTADKIKAGADSGLGGPELAAGFCSPVGLAAQATFAIGITVGAEVFSGGTATPAVTALWALRFAGNTAVSMIALSAVTHLIENATIGDELKQEIFSGALGGNLLAYSAREMSNITARSSGGLSLGNNNSTILGANNDELEAPRSLATRLFDIHDDHSLMNKAATTYYTSGFQNEGIVTGLANVTSSLTDIGGMLGRTFGSLMPRASAAATYSWGFPQYGLPNKVINNPEFENPWASGEIAAKDLLGGPDSSKYVEKANDCFGIKLTKGSEGWDATRGDMVDVTSEDYTNADCTENATVGSGSALDWQRVIMFGFDTLALKDAACASGIDETVCADQGSGSSSTVTPPSTTPGDQNGQCIQLDGVDGLNVSNQFPDDTTIIPKVTNVVIHWIDSNPESPEEVHSALASSGTSVEFYVSQSGKMMQLTPCANSRAGHAKNANDFAVGIEIGSPNAESIGDTSPYHQLEDALINNATQKAQVIKLATALAKKFGITTITVGNQTLYSENATCAALGLPFPGTCATQAEAAQFGIVGHYQLQNTKSDPGPTYVTQIQQGVKSGLGL